MRILIVAVTLGIMSGTAFVAAQSPPAGADTASFAYIDIARIASESTDGQAANARVQELSEQKVGELEATNNKVQERVNGMNQQLIEARQKLQQGQNVISVEAASSLQREISRLEVDIQRATQDSQAELQRMSQDAEAAVTELQQRLQGEFQTKLIPAIDKMAAEKGLSFIFNAAQGLVWADPSLDLTEELIETLNSQVATTP